MDQHQGFASAVDLVVKLDAVHISVATAHWLHRHSPVKVIAADIARPIPAVALDDRKDCVLISFP
jgi:hypothetical protein